MGFLESEYRLRLTVSSSTIFVKFIWISFLQPKFPVLRIQNGDLRCIRRVWSGLLNPKSLINNFTFSPHPYRTNYNAIYNCFLVRGFCFFFSVLLIATTSQCKIAVSICVRILSLPCFLSPNFMFSHRTAAPTTTYPQAGKNTPFRVHFHHPPPHHRNLPASALKTQNSRTQRRINFVCVFPQTKINCKKQRIQQACFQNRIFSTLL